jgi:nitrogen fixation/metabolism regulation signal transduction histidine kinase
LSAQDADTLNRATHTIVAQVAQLKGMVDAFSQYARSPELRLEALDMNDVVREVLALYESHATGIELDLDGRLPQVEGDAARLRQVIHNLLQNAEQAVAEVSSPHIVVSTRQEASAARLCVRDNGPGFPPDILARVFEPYVTTKTKGTGLGLAIVKKIVEEHNGYIEIRNCETSGAEVSIRLPTIEERRRAGEATAKVKAG